MKTNVPRRANYEGRANATYLFAASLKGENVMQKESSEDKATSSVAATIHTLPNVHVNKAEVGATLTAKRYARFPEPLSFLANRAERISYLTTLVHQCRSFRHHYPDEFADYINEVDKETDPNGEGVWTPDDSAIAIAWLERVASEMLRCYNNIPDLESLHCTGLRRSLGQCSPNGFREVVRFVDMVLTVVYGERGWRYDITLPSPFRSRLHQPYVAAVAVRTVFDALQDNEFGGIPSWNHFEVWEWREAVREVSALHENISAWEASLFEGEEAAVAMLREREREEWEEEYGGEVNISPEVIEPAHGGEEIVHAPPSFTLNPDSTRGIDTGVLFLLELARSVGLLTWEDDATLAQLLGRLREWGKRAGELADKAVERNSIPRALFPLIQRILVYASSNQSKKLQVLLQGEEQRLQQLAKYHNEGRASRAKGYSPGDTFNLLKVDNNDE